jgi:hypothetical protein
MVSTVVGNLAPATVVDNPEWLTASAGRQSHNTPAKTRPRPETAGGLGGDLDASRLFRRRIIVFS